VSIEDLRAPPVNRLEQLKGNRADQWTPRVHDLGEGSRLAYLAAKSGCEASERWLV